MLHAVPLEEFANCVWAEKRESIVAFYNFRCSCDGDNTFDMGTDALGAFISASEGESKLREEIHDEENAGESKSFRKEEVVHAEDLSWEGG